MIERPYYNHEGSRKGHEYVRCPCVNYDGPQPIEQFFTQPIEIPPQT